MDKKWLIDTNNNKKNVKKKHEERFPQKRCMIHFLFYFFFISFSNFVSKLWSSYRIYFILSLWLLFCSLSWTSTYIRIESKLLFILFYVFKSISKPITSSVNITPWILRFIHGASGRASVEHIFSSLITLGSISNLISGGSTSGRQKESLNLIFFSKLI
jgi:signal transduction histidine kinase